MGGCKTFLYISTIILVKQIARYFALTTGLLLALSLERSNVVTDGNVGLPMLTPAHESHFINEYAELKHQIKEAGLLEKQPFYYIKRMAILVVLLAVSIAILFLVKPFWLQILNAAFLAFITTQLGLVGHEAGHRQIFRTTWKNEIFGLVAGNLLIGLSNGWWTIRHNQHHSHPNEHELDPDVYIPFIAFCAEDLEGKGKFLLSIMRYQAYFFFPALTLAYVEMQRASIQYAIQGKPKYAVTERALLVIHFICYFGILFYCMGIWHAIIFMLLHHFLAGVYMGSIFAPNHKGMPVLEKNSKIDFLHRQIITARNVYAHPIIDFWYGGLNYQIEHHLFPSMSRSQLRKAQIITRAFCQKYAISYAETNMLQSYKETLSALHLATAPLRVASRVS